jgi:hypothetical protein
LGRFFRARNGSIFLFDSGWRFSVTDCAQLADWGRQCAEFTEMALTDAQIAKFVDGGTLSTSYRTKEGSWFSVDAGHRSEVFDAQALAESPFAPANPTVLLNDAVGASLPFGTPVTRSGVLVRDASSGSLRLVDGASTVAVSPAMVDLTVLRTLPARTLDARSVALLPAASGAVTGVLKTPDGRRWVLAMANALEIGTQLPASLPTVPVSAATMELLAHTGPPGPIFVREPGNASLYLVSAGQRRAVSSMSIVASLSAAGPAQIVTLEKAVLEAIPLGTPVLAPGAVVKVGTAPEIYVVDGLSTLRHVPSWSVLNSVGLSTTVRTVTRDDVAGYATGAELSTLWACGTERVVGTSGQVRAVTVGAADGSGLSFTPVDVSTCSVPPRVPTVGDGPLFVRTAEQASLYQARAGSRVPISTMGQVAALAGSSSATVAIVDQSVLDAMPVGYLIAPGSVVKSDASAQLFLVDGSASARHIESFTTMRELGIGTWSQVPTGLLAGYSVGSPAGTLWACGSDRYVGTGGTLRRLSSASASETGLPFPAYEPATCAATGQVEPPLSGPVFLRTAAAADLYLASAGKRRPIGSMATVAALVGSGPFILVLVEPGFLQTIPTGAPM